MRLVLGASATQFTTLSNITRKVGDGIAVGSGVATVLLSILASRSQSGPKGAVENTPNMLAQLLGEPGVLRASYPASRTGVPSKCADREDPSRGTRLQQLVSQWKDTGRLNSSNSADRDQKIEVLTTRSNSAVRVSIGDLTDRIAMLGDVRGRVSLIKRDLAQLVLVAHGAPQ